MCDLAQALTQMERQTILNRVHTHFITHRQSAGHNPVRGCVYHGYDQDGRRVSCAIGLFDTDHRLDHSSEPNLQVFDLEDTDPGLLADVFGHDTLAESDLGFLADVQDCHDQAVKKALQSDDFDSCFIALLDRRLARLAIEYGLQRPADSLANSRPRTRRRLARL